MYFSVIFLISDIFSAPHLWIALPPLFKIQKNYSDAERRGPASWILYDLTPQHQKTSCCTPLQHRLPLTFRIRVKMLPKL